MVRRVHAVLITVAVSLAVGIGSFIGGWAASANFAGGASLSSLVAALGAGNNAADTTPASLRGRFRVFWDVWNLVDTQFYSEDPLDQQRMIYGAIHGMLGALNDQYTVFQEPDVAAGSREQIRGEQEGIGAYLRVSDGRAYIDRPIPESPAERAGLRSGDEILAVDGFPTSTIIAGLNSGEAAARLASTIRGDKGTTVELTIQRASNAEVATLSIVRDTVPLISVYYNMLEGDVAYIQITEFRSNTVRELDRALGEVLAQQPRAMVLDLRNNPGGLLDVAQEVLGRFYSGVALYERMRSSELTELRTKDAPAEVQVYDLPLLVLVNGNSASASEIVAGALRDQRANTWLLGERTFGKGSVQNVHYLQDGSSARITIAHWLTPNHDAIHGIGITPQFLVPYSQETQYATACVGLNLPPQGQSSCFDSQLSWAVKYLLEGVSPPTQ